MATQRGCCASRTRSAVDFGLFMRMVRWKTTEPTRRSHALPANRADFVEAVTASRDRHHGRNAVRARSTPTRSSASSGKSRWQWLVDQHASWPRPSLNLRNTGSALAPFPPQRWSPVEGMLQQPLIPTPPRDRGSWPPTPERRAEPQWRSAAAHPPLSPAQHPYERGWTSAPRRLVGKTDWRSMSAPISSAAASWICSSPSLFHPADGQWSGDDLASTAELSCRGGIHHQSSLIIDSERCARLPKLLARSALLRRMNLASPVAVLPPRDFAQQEPHRSAPNSSTTLVGSTTLPSDFDIFLPSLVRKPCAKTRCGTGKRWRSSGMRPVDRMEADDVLADDVQISRPVAPELFAPGH